MSSHVSHQNSSIAYHFNFTSGPSGILMQQKPKWLIKIEAAAATTTTTKKFKEKQVMTKKIIPQTWKFY